MSKFGEIAAGLYPDWPGYKEHTTSRDAARAMAGRSSNLQRDILELLRNGPLSPDEAADKLGRSILSIRPRFSELVKMGKIEASGLRTRNSSGLMAKQYRLTLMTDKRQTGRFHEPT